MLKRKEFFGSGNSNENNSEQLNRVIAGTEITGDIVSTSGILIEGDVIGNISCSGQVKIGNSGKLKGNLVCVNAEIEGALEGELTIENLLILRSTARIKGDIEALKLNIEEGAFFEGACVMKAPLSSTSYNNDVSFVSEED
jgi:cytoskeletal protein CcmA (bactofilin family)